MNQTLEMNQTLKSDRQIYGIKRSNSLECTCEINHMKSLGRKDFKYSMCDVCSERLFYPKIKNLRGAPLSTK